MDFQNFETLIRQIETDLGDNFNQKFREARKKLSGLNNLPNRILFSEYDKDKSEWVYNRGGKKEIQYHLYLRNGELGYGLGINSQRGSFNNDDPAKIANSLGISFKDLYFKIKNVVPNYSFKIGSEDQLGKMKEEEFLLFGNSIPYLNDNKLDDSDYQTVISDLKKQFEVYCMVFELNNRKNETLSHQEIQLKEITKKINLLKYKRQIILQGPPGTGKTKLAKEIAQQLLGLNQIDKEFVKNNLNLGLKFDSVGGTKKFEIISINQDNIEITTSGENRLPTISGIIKYYKDNLDWKTSTLKNVEAYEMSLAKYITENVNVNKKDSEQVKLIQFHPSYTYEDFVRGIVAESKGEKIEYKNVNKTLGLFAEKALRNYIASHNNSSESNIEQWVDSKFEEFKSNVEAKLPEEQVTLSGDIKIYEVTDSYFKYAQSWQTPGYIKFSEFKSLVKAIVSGELELTNKQLDKEKFIHAHYRYTYYNALLKIFFDEYKYQGESYSEAPRNYVLIIDEINRANLSSVLGELIYALEYRGEAVESMYAVEDDNKLILPPNLYIIGTMNTADRSVGHIDYAIRRRFAFVDVPSENLKETQGLETFDGVLFDTVAALFDTNLSPEFEKKDVQLGHSYFIDKSAETDGASTEIRLEYEIKPILREYVRDGVLTGEKIKEKIEALAPSI
ncbi:AAA family ATPase [Flavobacterium psychrotrophum]|uniref:AAA family ATPase n=1 Tax=Flavobacterium psychrotrophum TaxID=2294119 RepID=UPI0019690A33|nr:AAA family ATPase [Flavobacterium psychrotrophum]